jgi:alpha-glucosidase
MGSIYMVIDAGWATSGISNGARRKPTNLTKPIPQIDIPALVAYGNSKNVRLWLWAYWTDIDQQKEEAFAQLEKWGIAGVKIDFMDRVLPHTPKTPSWEKRV